MALELWFIDHEMKIAIDIRTSYAIQEYLQPAGTTASGGYNGCSAADGRHHGNVLLKLVVFAGDRDVIKAGNSVAHRNIAATSLDEACSADIAIGDRQKVGVACFGAAGEFVLHIDGTTGSNGKLGNTLYCKVNAAGNMPPPVPKSTSSADPAQEPK